MNNLFFFLFYSNERLIIQTLNIDNVLQPSCVWNKVLLGSNIVKVLLTNDGIYLWTMGFENPLRNMIGTSLPKLKLILGNYKTWKKHRNEHKTIIKYTIDILMF